MSDLNLLFLLAPDLERSATKAARCYNAAQAFLHSMDDEHRAQALKIIHFDSDIPEMLRRCKFVVAAVTAGEPIRKDVENGCFWYLTLHNETCWERVDMGALEPIIQEAFKSMRKDGDKATSAFMEKIK